MADKQADWTELHDAGPRREGHRPGEVRRRLPRRRHALHQAAPQPDAARAREEHRYERGARDARREGNSDRSGPSWCGGRRHARRGRDGEPDQRARPDDGADVRGRADSRRRGGRRTDRRRGDREDPDRVRTAARSWSIRWSACGPMARTPARRATCGCVRRRRRARTQGRGNQAAAGAAAAAAAPAPRRRTGNRCQRQRRQLRRRRRGAVRGNGSRASAAGPRSPAAATAPAAGAAAGRGAAPPRRPHRRVRKFESSSGRRKTSRPRRDGQMPMGESTDDWSFGDIEAGFKAADLVARRDVRQPVDRPSAARDAVGDGLLAERQAVSARLDAEHRADGRLAVALDRRRRRTTSCSSASTPAAASAARFRVPSRWRFRR